MVLLESLILYNIFRFQIIPNKIGKLSASQQDPEATKIKMSPSEYQPNLGCNESETNKFQQFDTYNKMKRNHKQRQLPANFAQQLLDCQIEYRLASNPSELAVRQLLQLYCIGFQYYQSIRNHKYIYFQIKMKQVFDFMTTMKKNQANSQPKTSEAPLRESLQQKKQTMDQQISLTLSKQTNIENVRQIVNEIKIKNMESARILELQLQKQNKSLSQKLARRKQRIRFNKSLSTTSGFTSNLSSMKSLDENCISPVRQPLEIDFRQIINQNEGDDQNIEKNQSARKNFSQL